MEKLTRGPMNDLIFLEWRGAAGGYRIEQRAANPKVQAPAGLYLTPIGTSFFVYRPLEDYPAMYREFADVELSPDGVRSFANKYGSPEGDRIGYQGNHLEFIFIQIQKMRAAVEQCERGDMDALITSWPIADAQLVFDRIPGRDTPNLYVQPKTLKDAMWFQFAQMVSGHMKIRKCAQCPAWFAFGTGTGRRKSAVYCSDRCRKAAHEKRRRTRK